MPKPNPRSSKVSSSARKPPRHEWQLQDAKACFSELFRLARESGPQRVTRHGKAAVVILPEEEYERLCHLGRRTESLVRFFARSPLAAAGIQLGREPDYGRDVDL